MTKIAKDFPGQTVICTFEVTPGTAHDVIDALNAAYDEVISRQPGYVSGAVHLNDAQTRIATYSQWRDRRDYQAMLRSAEMRERNRSINAMCRHFEPVMYEVIETWQVRGSSDAATAN
ncbi:MULTISPECIES: antibiotic biosynthesis monooxygenase [Paracoccus]|uniref:Antibiotic biosynthesis monooxygenase n=1 Tax=Paracoccus litorisediminis TaxID=2006130 RepID=A0A844HQ87_9RHOB|nr:MULTISPECIES: antibiotic biosynthesis monooxygenase family protein [Paracoccus]MBD9527984.1 antibiotic biosynthesis monooxygenase [Paracoccus sp. PAR01]MTH59851.1 antibiotic biosynthesis monooxygenase [Paracoccus litorisediminis]